jgi:hypothetical protein
MIDITKQMREYELMLEVAAVPLPQRHQMIAGAALFFNRGWPINHFTVSMAARAGYGLVPPVYEGLGSEERYFQSTKPATHASESFSQPNVPEPIVPNYRRDGPAEDSGERERCTGWHRIDGSIDDFTL